MTENVNRPFSGLMVKPKPMPNLRYPRFQKWYNTTTWISSDDGTYKGHVVSGGRTFQDTKFANRAWHLDTPPTRSNAAFDGTVAMDLTTPFYMLAGTDGSGSAEDTIIGPDYYNMPLRLSQDLAAMNKISKLNTANFRPMFMRVLAISHKITFVNHSRFPLEIYYTVLPIGYQFNTLSGTAPHNDMTAHTFKKITIPAIRDAGDRSQKSTIDLVMSLKKMFPSEYELSPGPQMTSTDSDLSVDSASPWISVDPEATTNSMYRNIPPGQIANDSHSTPDFAVTKPTAGLRLQWYGKLQQPRDIGFTTEASATAGDYVGNNYDVHANCSWLVDMVKVAHLDVVHLGERAYPNQTI